MDDSIKKILPPILALTILVSGVVGFVAGQYARNGQPAAAQPREGAPARRGGAEEGVITTDDAPVNTANGNAPLGAQEAQVIAVVDRASPAVVSVIVSKDLPIIEQFSVDPLRDFFGSDDFFGFPFRIPQFRERGTERREVGGGTGFIISRNGLIMTNRHVVEDDGAEYTVLTNDGAKLPARVLARHPALDLAILKIDKNDLPVPTLGTSEDLKAGQSVIAIGNALGEFRNTVSLGVISGLRRTITAGGAGSGIEQLENVIQTDAAINPGNSGGPLLNLRGEVVGINVAVALGAQSVGFAIPIDQAKKMITEVESTGKLSVPFLGVRYVIITEALARANDLPVNYGAYIAGGASNEPAITQGSPAAIAGLREGDIILEMDGTRIDGQNTLAELITRHSVGQEVRLTVLRADETLTLNARLGER
ncbi:MAG: trypsin-like peptidase domain-containing protein [bacterium]|nr:trypsin-like peptidase domain-containing protein [bacterium]MDZ4296206.1 trypsin-like peptidase domain-containing protein [Patescibacteria group bacterium]